MKHYSKEELECYRLRTMSLLGRLTCTAHLKDCPACSKLLHDLDDDDTLIAEIKSSLRSLDEVATPLNKNN